MIKEHTYTGQVLPDETALVLRDGKVFPPGRSLEVRNHSPTGFQWGYEGSGPAQLALALLLDASSARALSERYYQRFKREVVAKWSNLPGDCWFITSTRIKEWLADRAFNEGSEDSDNP
jgi:hypothetical protein